MKTVKNIALIAHDHLKKEMLSWAKANKKALAAHNLCATASTGKLVGDALKLKIKNYKHGPMGGDMEVGAAIAEGKIDMLIFFIDPLKTQPHDVDVKALLRVATVYNIPVAVNRATADLLLD